MFAVTSKYEALRAAIRIQRENRPVTGKTTRSIGSSSRTNGRSNANRAFSLSIFFLPPSWFDSFRRERERNTFSLLLNDSQDCTRTWVENRNTICSFENVAKRQRTHDRSPDVYPPIRTCEPVRNAIFNAFNSLFPLVIDFQIYISPSVLKIKRVPDRQEGGTTRISSAMQKQGYGSPRARTDGSKHALSGRDYWVTGIKIAGISKTGARDGTYTDGTLCDSRTEADKRTDGRDRETTSRVMEP